MTQSAPARGCVDWQTILQYLPHRYPFLLVDRILELEPGKRIVGLKNVTINEPFFQGHFPNQPVMPGVLILEVMAQVGGILLMDSFRDRLVGRHIYFTGLDKVRFKQPVVPGDQLVMEMTDVRARHPFYFLHGEARVAGKLVAEAEFNAALLEKIPL